MKLIDCTDYNKNKIYDKLYDQIIDLRHYHIDYQIKNQIGDDAYWEIRNKILDSTYLDRKNLYETK